MVFLAQANNREVPPTLVIREGYPIGARPTKRVRLKSKKAREECNELSDSLEGQKK